MIRTFVRYGAIGMVVLVLAFLGLSLIPLETGPDRLRPGALPEYWTLTDGTRIAYWTWNGGGNDSLPPVIYLHGGPGGYVHSSVRGPLEEISRMGYRIYAYEQAGSGYSDRLERPKDYSFERHVADLQEIVDRHVAADRVILLGQSFGSMLAGHFVARHPEKVAGVVFVSPGRLHPPETLADGNEADPDALFETPDTLEFRFPPDAMRSAESMLAAPRIVMTSIAAMVLNLKWAPDPEVDAFTDRMADRFIPGMVCIPSRVPVNEGGFGGYAHFMSNWYVGVDDPRPALRRASIRALVVQGQCDREGFGTAYEYASLFRCEYRFVRDAGHLIWWERPEALVAILQEFLMPVGGTLYSPMGDTGAQGRP